MHIYFAPDHRPTTQEALQAFCDHKLASPRYRPETQSSYTRTLREFLALCPDAVYADELTSACVQRYTEDLQRRQLRSGSRHTKMTAVKAFFGFIEEQGVISSHIAQLITIPSQASAKPVRPVDADDAALLLRAVKEGGQPRDIALVAVLLYTGLSLSDMTALTLADLILAPVHNVLSGPSHKRQLPPTTSIDCKLRLRRRLDTQYQEAPLDEPTWQALNAYLMVRPASVHPQIFLTGAGAPLTLSLATQIVIKYARAAGMPWIRSRALRSGYVLRQLAAGTPLPAVQSRVSHRQVTTARRYLGVHGTSRQVSVALRRTCGVLIVDAAQQARRRLRALLESSGHHAFEAPDAVFAHDMLRLSRLSLVVLLAASKHAWSDVELLENGPNDGQLLADHRIILILSQREKVPEQLADPVASSHITVISRPIHYNTLHALIAQAFSELGAQDEPLEDEKSLQHP